MWQLKISARLLLLASLYCFFVALPSHLASGQSPNDPAETPLWVDPFTPLREFYVSPTGQGGQAVDYSGSANHAIQEGWPAPWTTTSTCRPS